MSKYVKVEGGSVSRYPYTLATLRADNPNTSFPATISDEVLANFNVYTVTRSEPDFDPDTHMPVEINPILVEDAEGDFWLQQWSIITLPEETAAANQRSKRDNLLAETDYLALSDQTLSAEMASYRQALRDITSQSGFPFSVTWPVRP